MVVNMKKENVLKGVNDLDEIAEEDEEDPFEALAKKQEEEEEMYR